MSDETPREAAERLMRPMAEPLVKELDPEPMSGKAKHALLRTLLIIAVRFLKGSVKETRQIPDDILVDAADSVITGTVDAIRGR